MIIALEGIDGTGKTTQALLLKESLEQDGEKVLIIGRRFIWQTIFTIFSRSEIIIADRYKDSLIIFFKIFGMNDKILKKFLKPLPEPDIIFFFEMDAKTAHERLKLRRRKLDRYESLKCLILFKSQFDKQFESKKNFKIDATKSKEEIREEIYGLYNSCNNRWRSQSFRGDYKKISRRS